MPKARRQPRSIRPKKARCGLCGQSYLYANQEVGLCLKCLNATKNSKLSRFQGERLLFTILKFIFKGKRQCINDLYSLILSPKGAPMQLDWFCPEYNLAFELQGDQHFRQVEFYQNTREDFYYQQECDRIKRETCRDLGITLIEVRTSDPLSKEYILQQIKLKAPKIYTDLTGKTD
jgi:hypothetical protein